MSGNLKAAGAWRGKVVVAEFLGLIRLLRRQYPGHEEIKVFLSFHTSFECVHLRDGHQDYYS